MARGVHPPSAPASLLRPDDGLPPPVVGLASTIVEYRSLMRFVASVNSATSARTPGVEAAGLATAAAAAAAPVRE